MYQRDTRSVQEKIALFRERFAGLPHVHGTYDPLSGRCWQVKQPVTNAIIHAHLTGKRPLGIYLLTGSRTRSIVVDYDDNDANAPIEYLNRAKHYGLDVAIEISKSKGYHAWCFFEPDGVAAAKARVLVAHILQELGQKAEVFPKQDAIDPGRGDYGNYINLPFFGRLVAAGRTVFVDPTDLRPFANQWRFLEGCILIPQSRLDEIIEVNEISPVSGALPTMLEGESLGAFEEPWTLPPCARRMLQEGVSEFQRVACFRLAVLLRRMGVPYDLTLALLMQWREKNQPLKGRRRLSDDEVRSQTAYAYQRDYKGCGCDEPAMAAYCSPDCRIRTPRPPPHAS